MSFIKKMFIKEETSENIPAKVLDNSDTISVSSSTYEKVDVPQKRVSRLTTISEEITQNIEKISRETAVKLTIPVIDIISENLFELAKTGKQGVRYHHDLNIASAESPYFVIEKNIPKNT